MKKTFFKSILCASLFVGALTSCNEVEDLYNPELVREKAKQALGLDIAPDQDWNMTSVVTANFTLNEDALSDYSFRIYSANPLDENSGAMILADYPVKTDAQGKANASFKFEMPSYLGYVYVARVDNHGRRWMGISKIQNGAINKAFGESKSASTKGVTDYALPTITCPYTNEQINDLLAGAYDLTQGLTNDQGFRGMVGETGNTVAKIAGEGVVSNYNFGFDAYGYGEYKLIIADGATWEISAEQLRITGVDIIVANGGKLKFTGKIELTAAARLIVMEGGIVDNTTSTAADENINISSPTSLIYNAGIINANKIYADNGAALQNATTGIWKTKTTKCAGGSGWENIINWGKIESEEICSNGNQATLYNGCLVRANRLTLDQVCLKENTAIEVPYISCNAFYLRENSIVRATTIKPNQPIIVDYVGTTNGNALLSTETLDLTTFPQQLDIEVHVEVNNLLNNGSYNEQFAIGYHDQWYNQDGFYDLYETFAVGESPLVITAEQTNNIENAECVGNGNIPNNNVPEVIESNSNIYAFEDMSIDGGDYDVNDVVLKCTKLENNQISIELLAAGATKKVYAFFRDTRTNTTQNLFGEVHEALLGYSNNKIINTGVGEDNVPTKKVIIDVAEGFLFSEHGDIYIADDKNRESHIPAFTEGFQPGDAPYAICVPTTWKYPKEWVNIIAAYPDFARWAGGDNSYANWYSSPINSKIY